MARRRKTSGVDDLLAGLDRSLRAFGADYRGLSLREKVLRLVEIFHDSSDLNVNILVQEHGYPRQPAIERLRLYFVANVGQVVAGDELAIVASISEWARRVRQLRVEDGYRILSGASPDMFTGVDLQPDQYLLTDEEPDHTSARRWLIANRIRRQSGGSVARVLAFLQANVEQIVTTEELAYVAKAREFARRTRELRTEQGYAVATRFTGRPDLGAGQYVLQSMERIAEPHDRNIPEAVQRTVYQRDRNECRACGWTQDDWNSDDPRILELHHRRVHADRGPNTKENLCVLCSRCHDDVHAGRLEGFIDA